MDATLGTGNVEPTGKPVPRWLAALNEQQRSAVTAGDSPLLVIAGAGTGKTNTLAHRVAHLLDRGVDPGRVLLLTFTRRASAEMIRRVEGILARRETGQRSSAKAARIWGGTFHAIGSRLLRIHGQQIGLGDAFTVVDRSDAEDLLNVVRSEAGLDKADVRFPRKGTCMAIYSRCVNAQEPVDDALKTSFPWLMAYPDKLKQLFKAYTLRKQQQNVLDYDDLLLYWHHLMSEPSLADQVRQQFDAVLVDEYQDTNLLQAGILKALRPNGLGLTVVGDDAQSIYSFRAATVDNILRFEQDFPGARLQKLEQNYRSVQPILDATNAVIAQCRKRYRKDLFTTRGGRQLPRLTVVSDENQQSDYVISRILEHLEEGISLRKQAVLFRTAHHSDALEVELSRRNIPFVKYGGLKFLEAAHVKDVLAILRVAENPRDLTSVQRTLLLLDGIGPAFAKKAMDHLAAGGFDPSAWMGIAPPKSASEQWPAFVDLILRLRKNNEPVSGQVAMVREFYTPILDRLYDQAEVRRRDVEQLEQVSGQFATRQALITDLTLDPPASTQDLAGVPLREEDYLILSTIHSAKGCEWDAVYVLHAADGNIPSDLATGSEAEVEEERRLFYVALTRAKDFLEVIHPLKYYAKKHATGDRHSISQLTRFLPDSVLERFERFSPIPTNSPDVLAGGEATVDLKSKVSKMWD